MKEQRIIVIVDSKGNPSIEVEGVNDASCMKETEPLEKAFGGVVIERKKKIEASRPVIVNKNTIKIGK